MIVEEPHIKSGQAHLYGFRFDPSKDDADVYFVRLDDRNGGWPVVSPDRRIIMFYDVTKASVALRLDPYPAAAEARLPDVLSIEETYVYDIGEVLDRIRQGERDDDALLSNFSDLLLDLLDAVAADVPSLYRMILNQTFGRLTFDTRELSEVFNDKIGATRRSAVNAVMWAIGAVWANAIILRD